MDKTPTKNQAEKETIIQCNFTIEKELRDNFKKVVYQTKGWEPGTMKEAFREAVQLWIERNKKNERNKSENRVDEYIKQKQLCLKK